MEIYFTFMEKAVAIHIEQVCMNMCFHFFGVNSLTLWEIAKLFSQLTVQFCIQISSSWILQLFDILNKTLLVILTLDITTCTFEAFIALRDQWSWAQLHVCFITDFCAPFVLMILYTFFRYSGGFFFNSLIYTLYVYCVLTVLLEFFLSLILLLLLF